MNKNLIIAAVVIILLILGAGGFLLMGKNQKSPEISNSQTANPTAAKENGIIGSIKDALAGNASLECDFTTDSGQHIISKVKNGSVRADIVSSVAEQSGSIIMKDKKMWFWNDESAFTMDVPDVEGVTVTPGASSQASNVVSEMEKYKQYCHAKTVADSEFTPPSNVKFQDMSEMMKAVPSGTMSPSGTAPAMSQEQIQEMMRKYQNPSQ